MIEQLFDCFREELEIDLLHHQDAGMLVADFPCATPLDPCVVKKHKVCTVVGNENRVVLGSGEQLYRVGGSGK